MFETIPVERVSSTSVQSAATGVQGQSTIVHAAGIQHLHDAIQGAINDLQSANNTPQKKLACHLQEINTLYKQQELVNAPLPNPTGPVSQAEALSYFSQAFNAQTRSSTREQIDSAIQQLHNFSLAQTPPASGKTPNLIHQLASLILHRVPDNLMAQVHSVQQFLSLENKVASDFLGPMLNVLVTKNAPAVIAWGNPNEPVLWSQLRNGIKNVQQQWPANPVIPTPGGIPKKINNMGDWFARQKGLVKAMEGFVNLQVANQPNALSVLNQAQSMNQQLNGLNRAAQALKKVGFAGVHNSIVLYNGQQITQGHFHELVNNFNRYLQQFQNGVKSYSVASSGVAQQQMGRLQALMLSISQYFQIATHILAILKSMGLGTASNLR